MGGEREGERQMCITLACVCAGLHSSERVWEHIRLIDRYMFV